MRRAAALVASLAVTEALALAVPAAAAQGQLIFTTSGRVVQNPNGCCSARVFPLGIENRTSETVFIHDQPNCQGYLLTAVRPGGSALSEFGAGVCAP